MDISHNRGKRATFATVAPGYRMELTQGLMDGYHGKSFAEFTGKAAQQNYEIARLVGVTAKAAKIALYPVNPRTLANGTLEHWLAYVSSLGGLHSVPGWKSHCWRPNSITPAAFTLEDLGL